MRWKMFCTSTRVVYPCRNLCLHEEILRQVKDVKFIAVVPCEVAICNEFMNLCGQFLERRLASNVMVVNAVYQGGAYRDGYRRIHTPSMCFFLTRRMHFVYTDLDNAIVSNIDTGGF